MNRNPAVVSDQAQMERLLADGHVTAALLWVLICQRARDREFSRAEAIGWGEEWERQHGQPTPEKVRKQARPQW